jgi:Tfp pilus tip-associated adhesin PilY1
VAGAAATSRLVPYLPSSTLPGDFFYQSAPDAGKQIGFLANGEFKNGVYSGGDLSYSGNCSGWWFQSASAPLPLVRIPRDYIHGANCDRPPQNSEACIRRLLRPQGVLVKYEESGGFATSYDHDNPGYYQAGDKYADGCDAGLLGAADPRVDLDLAENQAIVANVSNRSQAPIKNLLNNIYDYLNSPSVDGFQNGKRLDDPDASCRTTAVILLYDTFNGCQNDSCNFLTSMNGGLTAFKQMNVPIYVIGLGMAAGATANTGICIAQNSGALIKDGAEVGYFPVESPQELFDALEAITSYLTESTKDFASASISSVQAGGEQMAYLATFNASKARTIWNGRLAGYRLDEYGAIPQGTRTVTDQSDPFYNVALTVPSNDPAVLIWNAGMNLAFTPGTGATDPAAILAPGAGPTPGFYTDGSTDLTTTIPTRSYPGRKVVFSLPATYPKDGTTNLPTVLPLPAASTVPEVRDDMVASTAKSWWPTMTALLGPQLSTDPATNRLSNAASAEALRFIWGDRDAVTGASKAVAQYGGLKLGDIFHSNPVVVGPPANYFYWASNVNDYRAYVTKYKNRRQVLYAGANDGLFHAFDVGVWNRDTNVCSAISTGSTPGCFDLGTGLELFAYAPRATMPVFHKLRTLEEQDKTNEWTVDGAPAAADVFIDPSHTGTPTATDREWRSVVISSAREGSPFQGTPGANPYASYGSVFALDVTQPDVQPQVDPVVDPDDPVAEALFNAPACLNGGSGCDAPWPAVLWEISDRGDRDSGTSGAGYADMGETWSKPGIGRVKICPNGGCSETEKGVDRYVAVFGGGFDRERLNRRGNWLYMVDVETGHVLYRANSSCGVNGGVSCVPFGSMPAPPSVLDLNGDGYLDRVYIGDMKGQMWRVDVSDLRWASTVPSDRWANKLAFDVGSATPFLLFRAPQPNPLTTPPNQFHAIYQASVVFSAAGNALGIGFGTGDRDDILAGIDPVSLTYAQRFYVVFDRGNTTTLTEADLTLLPTTVDPAQTTSASGWVLRFGASGGERLITDPIALQGYLFFSTFSPFPPGTGDGPCLQATKCSQSVGKSNFYAISAATGNPFPGEEERSTIVENTDFVTNPIAYQSADQQMNIGFMTASGGFQKPAAPRRTSSTVREWKER